MHSLKNEQDFWGGIMEVSVMEHKEFQQIM